jgi:nucleolar protein 9
MPKQNKKRGRRSERKREPEDRSGEQVESKRVKYDEEAEPQDESLAENADYMPLDEGGGTVKVNDAPFYGMLDEQESEYFRKTGEMLELNQFNGPEDRDDFIQSIHNQLEGKELKLAFSQGTSRVLEKIIKVSTPAQLKKLFKVFSGKYVGQFCCDEADQAVLHIPSSIGLPLIAAKHSSSAAHQ